jgi:hypothetical protein
MQPLWTTTNTVQTEILGRGTAIEPDLFAAPAVGTTGAMPAPRGRSPRCGGPGYAVIYLGDSLTLMANGLSRREIRRFTCPVDGVVGVDEHAHRDVAGGGPVTGGVVAQLSRPGDNPRPRFSISPRTTRPFSAGYQRTGRQPSARGRRRFSFRLANHGSPTCSFAEFSSKWRTCFSHLRGGS